MKTMCARWSLLQLLTIVFTVVMAGSAFAAAGDQLMHNSNNLGTKYGVLTIYGDTDSIFTILPLADGVDPNNLEEFAVKMGQKYEMPSDFTWPHVVSSIRPKKQ